MMVEKGKDEGRVGLIEEEVALTQKMTLPKHLRDQAEPESVDTSPRLVRPTIGGAVDADALKRVRRVAPGVSIGAKPPPYGSQDDVRTVARRSPVMAKDFDIATEKRAYVVPERGTGPAVDDAPTTRRPHAMVPDTRDEVTAKGMLLSHDDGAEGSRTADEREPPSFVTKQVPAHVARMLRAAASRDGGEGQLGGAAPGDSGATAEARLEGSLDKSEALVLDKLTSRGPATKLSHPGRDPSVAQERVDPMSQLLHTLPMGVTARDILGSRAPALVPSLGDSDARPPDTRASAQIPDTAPQGYSSPAAFPSASHPAVGAAAPFPSPGPQGAAQRPSGHGSYPPGSFPRQDGPAQQPFTSPSQSRISTTAMPGGPFQPGSGSMPHASGPAPQQGPRPGTFPPGSMSHAGPQQGSPPGTFPAGERSQPPFNPGLPPRTFPPGVTPQQQGPPRGTYPPGSVPQGQSVTSSLPPLDSSVALQSTSAPFGMHPSLVPETRPRKGVRWAVLLFFVLAALGGAWFLHKRGKLPFPR